MQTRVVYNAETRRFCEYENREHRYVIFGVAGSHRDWDLVLEARLIKNGKALGSTRPLRGQDYYSSRCIMAAYDAWVAAGRPDSFCWEE